MRPRDSVRGDEIRRACFSAIFTASKRVSQIAARFARAHPVRSLATVLLLSIVISDVFRGCDRTGQDIERIAASFRDFFAMAPALHHSLEKIERGTQGIRSPIILYPAKLAEIVRKAHREGSDILSSFEMLDAAWRKECPNDRLTIGFVYRPLASPTIEGQRVLATDSSEPIENDNFERFLPLLLDIRDLILSSDGDEPVCGKLFHSGYQAEPAEAAMMPAVR